MRVIDNFDLNNYEDCKSVFHRIAVRAIIIKNNQIALIRSVKFKEYKFPGGGQEDGESNVDTLIRETLEETGLRVIVDTIKPYGMAKEKRKSVLNPNDLFQMESYYYVCDVFDGVEQTTLDVYEDEYGYQLHFVDIDDAILANEKAAIIYQQEAPWINRELAVFKDIKLNLNL